MGQAGLPVTMLEEERRGEREREGKPNYIHFRFFFSLFKPMRRLVCLQDGDSHRRSRPSLSNDNGGGLSTTSCGVCCVCAWRETEGRGGRKERRQGGAGRRRGLETLSLNC
jgi:hypothetical protein